jgi:two-component system sensor histidine kinase/response regulator
VDDRLPRYAEGDPNRIRQVLVNLVNNAVKFTAEGSIRVRAELRRAKGIQRILVQVRDTRIGIPEDRQDRLFQPFSQVDASMTRKFGGTGLGLSISRDLVGMMDGRIGVKSKPGLGSNFWFSLPLKMASGETVASAAPASVHPGFKALIIDDAQESAQTISEYLSRWQVSTVVERSAASGIEEMTNAVVRGGGYDIVLIDLRLPDMDGWQLASEVRNDPVLEKTPLVLMSPLGESTGDAKMKLLRWFDAYINKPVKVRELTSAFEQIFAGDIEELEAIDAEPVELEEIVEDGDRLPETVLVAEDHFVNQQLFQTILEKQGFRTLVASDGLEAVEAMQNHPEIGLIFMDVQMPNLNGYDATTRIRDLGFGTPIIAVTANALSGDRDRCIRVGMNEYMSKPFKKSDIEAVLGRLRAAGAFRAGSAGAVPSIESEGESTELADDEGALEELASVAEDDSPPIDLREAIEAFMGDAATTERVVRKFADRIAGQIDEVVDHLDAGRISDARVVSHAVKGGAWNLHCADLGDASKAVEDACAAEDPTAARAGVPAMRKEAERLRSYVETIDFSVFE